MANSTVKELVNKVLRLSGDAKPLTATETIDGSLGGIAERILEFFNVVIADVEMKTNWNFLRSDSFGTTDGINDTFEFTGADDVAAAKAVSVTIDGVGSLQELSPAQFASQLAIGTLTTPTYFTRQTSAAGKLQVQIYPTPPAGQTLNVTAYKTATRFVVGTDTTVSEFEDTLLIYGALMHLDSYDGLDRGYAQLFGSHLANTLMTNFGNREYRVTMDSYQ